MDGFYFYMYRNPISKKSTISSDCRFIHDGDRYAVEEDFSLFWHGSLSDSRNPNSARLIVPKEI